MIPSFRKTFNRLIDVATFNGLTKLISIGVAIVLWVVVLGSRSTEVAKEIPLEIQTADDVAPVSELPDRITFRMIGPKAFMRTILDRREIPIRVNLTGAKSGLIQYRFAADNIKLPIGVKIISIVPPGITVMLEPIRSRSVPVRVETRGILPKGYQVIKSELIPSSVRIKGSKSRVSAVTEVTTMPIDLTDQKQSIQAPAQLDLVRWGVELDEAAPLLRMEIRPTVANFRIKNVGIRVLSELRSTFAEKSVTAMVMASSEALKNLDQRLVFAEIDLRGKTKGKYKSEIQVRLPPDIGLVKVIPEMIDVTLY